MSFSLKIYFLILLLFHKITLAHLYLLLISVLPVISLIHVLLVLQLHNALILIILLLLFLIFHFLLIVNIILYTLTLYLLLVLFLLLKIIHLLLFFLMIMFSLIMLTFQRLIFLLLVIFLPRTSSRIVQLLSNSLIILTLMFLTKIKIFLFSSESASSAVNSHHVIEPKYYNQAKHNPNWINAMTKELKALEANETWDLTLLLAGKESHWLKMGF